MLLLPCASAVGLMLAAPCSPSESRPQSHRPDAEGYPCSSTHRLAIVQDGPGFAIRPSEADQPVSEPDPTESAADAPIAIGGALKIDRKILLAGAGKHAEAAHAPRR